MLTVRLKTTLPPSSVDWAKHQNRLSAEVVDTLFLETFKMCLEKALSNHVVYWKVSLGLK